MEKFIPLKKLSKKKRRQLAAQRRGTWGGLNPVTRKPANPKAYNRKKARKWSEDSMAVSFCLLLSSNGKQSKVTGEALRDASFYCRAL